MIAKNFLKQTFSLKEHFSCFYVKQIFQIKQLKQYLQMLYCFSANLELKHNIYYNKSKRFHIFIQQQELLSLAGITEVSYSSKGKQQMPASEFIFKIFSCYKIEEFIVTVLRKKYIDIYILPSNLAVKIGRAHV